MCTVVSFLDHDSCFGRNMDTEGSFGEEVVITPRHFSLSFRHMAKIETHYALVGMAAVMDGYPLYADGMNERGLCMAALNFVDNAYYFSLESAATKRLAPYELIPWVLATCATVAEARRALAGATVVASPFRSDVPLSQLHWILSDRSGCLVVEPGEAGLALYENPYGVLTNNPPFPYHRENVRMYEGLTEDLSSLESFFSYGTGAIGLPGDYSSPSRFVRAEFLRRCACRSGRMQPCDVYRILDAVAPPRGCVRTEKGEYHYTTYSCCMDVSRSTYGYATLAERQPTEVALTPERCEGRLLLRFPVK